MRKILTFLLLTGCMMSAFGLSSCKKIDEKAEGYEYTWYADLEYIRGYESTYDNFIDDLNGAVEKWDGRIEYDSQFTNEIKKVVAAYDYEVISGTVKVYKFPVGLSYDSPSARVIATYRLHFSSTWTKSVEGTAVEVTSGKPASQL